MVSLTFGQIRDFPSRVDADEDDTDVQFVPKSFSTKIQIENPTMSLMIVTTCNLSKAFCDIYFNSVSSVVGSVYEDSESKSKEIAQILCVETTESKNEIFVFKFLEDISEEYLNDVAKELLRLKPKDVVILCSERLSLFKREPGTFEDVSSISRCLKSSEWKSKSFTRLEQPNIIAGLPAAVLTECEFRRTSGLIVLNYSDSPDPDSLSLSGFKKIFQLPSLKKFHSDAGNKKLTDVATRPAESLYL